MRAIVAFVADGLVAGCGGPPRAVPSPSPSPSPASPARPSAPVALPEGWTLPLPPGARVKAVNWGERSPGHEKIELDTSGAKGDVLDFYAALFKDRGFEVTERWTDRRSSIEAVSGAERYSVEAWGGGAIVNWWRP